MTVPPPPATTLFYFIYCLQHPVFPGGLPPEYASGPTLLSFRSLGIARVQGGVAADSATALNVSFCYLLASVVSDDEFLLLLLSNCLFWVATVRLCCISAWRSLSLWRFIAFLKICPLAVVSPDSLCLFLSLLFFWTSPFECMVCLPPAAGLLGSFHFSFLVSTPQTR